MSTHKEATYDAETVARLDALAERTPNAPVSLWVVDLRRLRDMLRDDARRRQALRVLEGLR